ncbi:hypothetical protein BZG36_00964 [Bifiguratus adelaidae]|uniref:Uncharacterized protein n=1 Tax=Bifiguratus adelaidae TaxID=1938954 RepID=A0A261Y671_9FUNG|nr:hypothetical protein BZG36_00964 [Bifiguratus adelaidae]
MATLDGDDETRSTQGERSERSVVGPKTRHPDIQHVIRVLKRSFVFAWLITTAPALVRLLLSIRKLGRVGFVNFITLFATRLRKVLVSSLVRNGTPWLFALTFGGSEGIDLLRKHPEWLLKCTRHGLNKVSKEEKCSDRSRNDYFRSSLFASALALSIVHHLFPKTTTIDLTFFATVRAFDIWAHRAYYSRRVRDYVPTIILEHGDVLAFCVSCTEIMFNWFYEPQRLPRTYNRWISYMANMDERLLTALRAIRNGEIRYGEKLGDLTYLRDYAAELGLPASAGDIAEPMRSDDGSMVLRSQ